MTAIPLEVRIVPRPQTWLAEALAADAACDAHGDHDLMRAAGLTHPRLAARSVRRFWRAALFSAAASVASLTASFVAHHRAEAAAEAAQQTLARTAADLAGFP